MRYGAASLLLMVLLALSLHSCKKGCTNSSAFNYNPSAKEDDASCLFCDSVKVDNYAVLSQYTDNNSSSTHYQESVLQLRLTGSLLTYRGNHCANLQIRSGCDTLFSAFPNFAYLNRTFTNLTGDTILVSGTFSYGVTGGPFNPSTGISQFKIAPLADVVYGEVVYLDCVQADFASGSISLTGRSFQYR